MIDATKVKIHITPTSVGTEIWLDGKKQENVKRLAVFAAVNEPTRVEIEYAICEVDIDGDVATIDRAE